MVTTEYMPYLESSVKVWQAHIRRFINNVMALVFVETAGDKGGIELSYPRCVRMSNSAAPRYTSSNYAALKRNMEHSY